MIMHLYNRFGNEPPFTSLIPYFVYASSKCSCVTAQAQLGIGSSASQYQFNMIGAGAMPVLKIAFEIGYDRQFVSKM